ncbi:hypothetical protein FOL47_008163 [Perkinsus chesapeaki]|uniref:G-patch domain-containing protein n=1 Tax=Perkinsus chesapeaki TaxID=330153 RepID=A0A7J6MUQ3_PERCH|nr:hypothetical protein FOL47_008163 [Perkinsus chesapeaki]
MFRRAGVLHPDALSSTHSTSDEPGSHNGRKKQEDYMDTMSTDQMNKTYGVGYRLLCKNGYSGEGSLGKTNKGVTAPIAVYRRRDKEGLRDDEREQRVKQKLNRRARRQKRRNAHGPQGDIATREKLLQGLVRLIRSTGQDQMPLWLAAHKVQADAEGLRSIIKLYPKHFQITHYEGEDHVVLRNLSADTIVCECSASFPTRDACILHLSEVVVNPTNPTDATHPQLIGRLSETSSGQVDTLYCLVCDTKFRSAIALAVHSLGARVDESISEHRQFGYSLLCAAASGNEDDFDQFFKALKSHDGSFNWDSFGAACADPGVEIEFSEPDVLCTGEIQSCGSSDDSVSEVAIVDLDETDEEEEDCECVEIVSDTAPIDLDSRQHSRPSIGGQGWNQRRYLADPMISINDISIRCNDPQCNTVLGNGHGQDISDVVDDATKGSRSYKCLNCPHIFCRQHAVKWFKSGRVCPVCNARTGVASFTPGFELEATAINAPVTSRNPSLGYSPMVLADALYENYEFHSEQLRMETSKTMIPRQVAQAKLAEAAREYAKRAEKARAQTQTVKKEYLRVKTQTERLKHAIAQQEQELQRLAHLLRCQGIACGKASREASASAKRRRVLHL